MTTVLRASPRRFVSTPAVERVATRALRYLQSGFSVHLRGPAGTGKTTLALHLADMIARPIMLLFGDDEFKTSDLIGNQSGYTRKKVVDNFIHSVVKVEDELRQNWVDARLTLACREGFTLVYDEFNRSRPEVNNVLLSALEEKLLVLPPSHNRTEYIRVHPQFRAIFTSNPEEYCGVHATQDALLDRLVTINMPEPDELTQQEIAVQKTGIDRESASIIVQLVRMFRTKTGAETSSGLRSCLILAKICQEHEIIATPENAEFRDICQDVLLSRARRSLSEATQILWDTFNEMIRLNTDAARSPVDLRVTEVAPDPQPSPESDLQTAIAPQPETQVRPPLNTLPLSSTDAATDKPKEEPEPPTVPYERDIFEYLQRHPDVRPSEIETALGITRFQTINALNALRDKGLVTNRGGSGRANTYRVCEGERA
ncbi:gas vesicle protein GvpN [Thermoleptolyngbya sp. M55_K2018_002]|uniref:gas vesicle protein GvpN n=1 Tax=Thermoleptolyngbya sp. M55_K2018_002 TaxID=2747808 RepID=UPI0019ED8FFA|nr:gas vesicle protein GvpN [Thermoleptolyngbya sp. M55_K2018_002]HIK42873.1 gas vesicle protein GvpN [Thermoleptolyngbya sp. M55_K2018_002]